MRAILTILLVAAVVVVANAVYVDDVRTAECYVIENDGYMTVLEDSDGHLWDVIDNSYLKGEAYTVTFKTNHTAMVFDDEIIKAERFVQRKPELKLVSFVEGGD